MALTPAEKQRRYRERLSAQAQSRPDVVEAALLQDVERGERGELSPQERTALADKLANFAMTLLWRAQKPSKLAERIREGSDRSALPP
jgi:hypothetical protein